MYSLSGKEIDINDRKAVSKSLYEDWMDMFEEQKIELEEIRNIINRLKEL